ncbi:MAG: two-component regulator propeller domain-containing protein [Breznakibacter sp.]
MKKRLYASIAFAFCLLLPLSSQKALDFDALAIDDGFSSSKAISIIQDKKGFIWIGTWNGLNKYDGYKCEIYKPLHHDRSTLTNKEVTALLEDREGFIWIGTSNGLNKLNPETEELVNYPFPSRIMAVYEDQSHVIWIGTWSDGLFRLDPITNERQQYLNGTSISDIHEDSQGEFWLATYNGLINLNRQTGSFTPFQPNPSNPNESISNIVTTQIAETGDGSLWIGTWGGGLNKMVRSKDKSQVKFIHYQPESRKGSIASADVYKVLHDAYGNLWIGSWDQGLSLLSPEEQSKAPNQANFTNYANQITNPYSLSGNNVSALLVDRSGVLWVGSSKIDRAYILPTGLVRNNTQKLVDNHISESVVRSLGGDKRQRLWIGTTETLELYAKTQRGYEFSKLIKHLSYQHKGQKYVSASVLEIIDHPTGLWVGTDNAGLLHFMTEEAINSSKPNFRFWNDQTDDRLPGNKIDIIVPSRKISQYVLDRHYVQRHCQMRVQQWKTEY